MRSAILTSVSISQDDEGTVTNRLVVSRAQTASAATSPVSTLVLKLLKPEGTKHTADLTKNALKNKKKTLTFCFSLRRFSAIIFISHPSLTLGEPENIHTQVVASHHHLQAQHLK